MLDDTIENSKIKWWQTAKGRNVFMAYSLRRILGFEGLRSLKERNWSLVGLSLLALGIVSDITQILAPFTDVGVLLSLSAVIVFGIIILRRLHFCNLCIAPFVISLFLLLFFSVATVAHQTDDTPNNGIIVDAFPALESMQKEIINYLGNIGERVANVEDTLDVVDGKINKIQESQQRTEGMISALATQNLHQHLELLSAIAEEKGVPKTAMISHLMKLGANPEIQKEEIPKFLANFADSFLKLKQRLLSIDVNDEQLNEIRKKAFEYLEDGNLDAARNTLRDARAVIKKGRQNSALKEATLLADEAAIDTLELKYRIAADKYMEAADITVFNEQHSASHHYSAAYVLYMLGDEFGDNNALIESLTLYNQVLLTLTRDSAPLRWANIQNNMGNVLNTLGQRMGDTALLERAIVTYKESLKEHTRDRVPIDWSDTQNNLGNVLTALGNRKRDTALLEQAVTTYREALKERPRDRVPLKWARTQHNLASALTILGAREGDTVLLEQAVTTYREVLKEFTRDRMPREWATIQNNLAAVLRDLGERKRDTTLLEQAITTYREALKELTRDRVPLDWARTLNNLGIALTFLGENKNDTDLFEQAITTFREALKERTRDRVPLKWAWTQNNICWAISRIIELSADDERYLEGETACQNSIDIITKNHFTNQRGLTTHSLAYLYMVTAELRNDSQLKSRSIELFNLILKDKKN
ncbi:MAG: tetratricopeptide repeat protein, partial [Emcibacteraceae bacterium]|nr:tetratricopeptide repeat protein [Emcibacteraceae bacterium]